MNTAILGHYELVRRLHIYDAELGKITKSVQISRSLFRNGGVYQWLMNYTPGPTKIVGRFSAVVPEFSWGYKKNPAKWSGFSHAFESQDPCRLLLSLQECRRRITSPRHPHLEDIAEAYCPRAPGTPIPGLLSPCARNSSPRSAQLAGLLDLSFRKSIKSAQMNYPESPSFILFLRTPSHTPHQIDLSRRPASSH